VRATLLAFIKALCALGADFDKLFKGVDETGGVTVSKKAQEIVYVLMPTYNQVDYIKDAVSGVMAQVLDVPLVLVLQDDASTDGTAILAKELSEIHKDRIKLILNKENQFLKQPDSVGLMLEYVSKVEKQLSTTNCILKRKIQRDAFVALCEGDDFWTNANKLQVQIDHMRADKDLTLIHHAAEVRVDPGGSEQYAKELMLHLGAFEGANIRRFGSFYRFSHNVITCSALFRLSALNLGLFVKKPVGSLGDWVLFALLTRRAEPKYLSESMAAYRVRAGSLWSSKPERERQITFLKTQDYIEGIFRTRKP
jgi:hypothetical protein